MRRISPIPLLLCSLYALPVAADTITVDLNGGADYTAIAEAVAAAVEGDVVLVYPGYYEGPENSSIDFEGKDIELRSVDGPDSTIINGYMFDHIFLLQHWERAVIEGFTAGYTSAFALVCDDAHVTVRGCRFTGLTAFAGDPIWAQGTAVGRVTGGSLTLEDCLFDGNWCRSAVSTLDLNDCDVTMRNCVFLENAEGDCNIYNVTSGVLAIRGVSSVTLEGCAFIDNVVEDCCLSVRGYATVDISDCTFKGSTPVWNHSASEGLLHLNHEGSASVRSCSFVQNEVLRSCITALGTAETHIENCTFAGNSGSESVIVTPAAARGDVFLTSCVLAFNDCPVPVECDVSLPAISSSCFYETGDLDSMCEEYDPETVLLDDPLFCDFYAGDFTLCLNSPCLVPHNDWGVQIGAHGWGCDACGTPVGHTSWGSIKAMFR